MGERLQKILARAGLGSRRACEQLIREQRVLVNGNPAVLGQRADLKRDQITVDGNPLGSPEAKRYFMLNKPVGYITSVKDQYDRKTVLDLMPKLQERVYPVGRLDYDSQGLVFLTNDGPLAHRIMHPKFGLPKAYLVEVKGRADRTFAERLRRGITLTDGPTSPARVSGLKAGRERSQFVLTLKEGRNRQIRRMCAALGYQVLKLTRISLGPLELGDLAPGAARALTEQEIRGLERAANRSEGRI